MITLKTDCGKCMHNNVCKNLGKAKADMMKLRDMTYSDGSTNEYDWESMSKSRHVDIEFSCPDFLINRNFR